MCAATYMSICWCCVIFGRVECLDMCVDVYRISVFFFKQKTAYELRISDWSSDVCSSDLLGSQIGRQLPSWRRGFNLIRELTPLSGFIQRFDSRNIKSSQGREVHVIAD